MPKKITALTFLYFALLNSTYSQCTAPEFNTIPETKEITHNEEANKNWTSVTLNPSIASLKIPSELSDIFISSGGSLGFKNETTNLSGMVVFETNDDYFLPEQEISIYRYYKTLFENPKESYCTSLQAFNIDDKDYKYHIPIDGGEVFAFGSKDNHRFYILNEKIQNYVTAGLIKNIDIKTIKEILQTIKITQ